MLSQKQRDIYINFNNIKGGIIMLKLDKKLYKILAISLMIVMFASVMLPVFAEVRDPTTIDGTNVTSFDSILKTVLGTVQVVGSFAAVIVLIVVGIRYMTGSVEEKAEYKKTMIPYIVGALLVFAASNIVAIIYNLRTSI